MKTWGIAKAYLRQWLHGIEIAEIAPGLFQSSAIRWPWDKEKVKAKGIDVVIDLSGQFDPSMDWLTAYLYWPIKDEAKLPPVRELHDVAEFASRMLWTDGHRVLIHCTAGFNRSGLVNGVILNVHGISGAEALRMIRQARPGALSNPTFATYVVTLPGGGEPPTQWKGRRLSRGKDWA